MPEKPVITLTDSLTFCQFGLSGPEIDCYLAYLREFRDFTNACLEAEGIDARIDIDALEAKLGSPDLMAMDQRFCSAVAAFADAKLAGGNPPGVVFRGQIATAAAAIGASLLDGCRHLAILGSTQSGKSGTMNVLFALESVLFFQRTGRLALPLICLVNKNDLFRQFVAGFNAFFDLHEGIAVTTKLPYPGVPTKLFIGAYFRRVFKEIAFSMDSLPVFNWEQGVHKNAAGVTNVGRFHRLMDKARASGIKVFCSIDEAHHGSRAGGVFWRMAYPYIASVGDRHAGVDFRAISATNWEHSLSDSFTPVAQRLDRGYVGCEWFRGHRLPCIDPTWTVKPPTFARVSDLIARDLQISKFEKANAYERLTLQELKRAATGAAAAHDAAELALADEAWHAALSRTPADWTAAWRGYRRQFVNGLKQIISKTLLERGEPGEGLCLRCCRRNLPTARKLVASLNAWLARKGQNVVVIGYWGEACQSTVGQTILAENPDGKRYVMLVTGGARMGVEFPPSCRFFVDLTHRPSTSTAEVQGLFGRASGYGKRSEVWVSDDAYGSIAYYLDHQGHPRKRPHMRVAGMGAGKPCHSVNFYTHKIRRMPEGRDQRLLLGLIGQMEAKIVSQRGQGAWLQGRTDNSRPLWPLVDAFIELAEEHPELAEYGNEGSFVETPLVRRQPALDVVREDCTSDYTDANGRHLSDKITRRKRYLDETTVDLGRGRTSGLPTELSGGGTKSTCQVQIEFDLDVATAQRRNAGKVSIRYLNLPLRVPQQKFAEYDLTEKSAWHRDSVSLAIQKLAQESNAAQETTVIKLGE